MVWGDFGYHYMYVHVIYIVFFYDIVKLSIKIIMKWWQQTLELQSNWAHHKCIGMFLYHGMEAFNDIPEIFNQEVIYISIWIKIIMKWLIVFESKPKFLNVHLD